MTCPNCGAKLEKGRMYCEKCGTEIQMVPDFEPEIENSISETLETVVKDALNEQEKEDTAKDSKENADKVSNFLPHQKLIFMGGILLAVIILIIFSRIGVSYHNDHSAEAQIKTAKSLSDKGNYTAALTYYQKAVHMDPSVDNHLLLAKCYHDIHEDETAIEEYLKVLDIDDKNTVAYDSLISLYESMSDYHSINTLLTNCTDDQIKLSYQQYLAIAPEFNYPSDSYDEVVPLKLIAPSSGKIYYTLDGSTPSKGSLLYTSPIFLKGGVITVRAVYINQYGIASEVVTNTYDIASQAPDAPTIEPDSGHFNMPTMITVTVPQDSQVYYTTDGSDPNEFSSIYGEPIPMALGNSSFRFVAISSEGVSSEVVEKHYSLSIETTLSEADAIRRLKNRLVELDRLADADGNLINMSGKHLYVYNSLRVVDGKVLFYIYEYYQQGNSSRNMTGTIYAVDAKDGWVYKVIKGANGEDSLEPV